jgi:hypothetical protein
MSSCLGFGDKDPPDHLHFYTSLMSTIIQAIWLDRCMATRHASSREDARLQAVPALRAEVGQPNVRTRL